MFIAANLEKREFEEIGKGEREEGYYI